MTFRYKGLVLAYLAAIAALASEAHAQARPTSTKRIPIVKEHLAPRVDTVTKYDTVRVDNLVTRVDTVKVVETHQVVVHDTTWVEEKVGTSIWPTVGKVVVGAAAAGVVVCGVAYLLHHYCLENINNNYNDGRQPPPKNRRPPDLQFNVAPLLKFIRP